MRKVRWTPGPAGNLEKLANYLFERAPEQASELVRTIYRSPERLLHFPHLGRPGKMAGTRELVLSPLPYVIVYRLIHDSIEVLRVLHGARSGPALRAQQSIETYLTHQHRNPA